MQQKKIAILRANMYQRLRCCVIVTLALLLTSGTQTSIANIVTTAKQWLETPPSQRSHLEPTLKNQTSNITTIIEQLRPSGWTRTQTGQFYHQDFSIPDLYQRYGDLQFSYRVPPNYTPSAPIGLHIYMHGGGREPSNIAQRDELIRDNGELDHPHSIGIAPLAPMSQICPQWPYGNRWICPDADRYIEAIIIEMNHRYNIDLNKIIIGGHSMGGIGAYYMALRLPDRFAAVYSGAGSFNIAPLRALLNTPLYMIHGTHDSYWNSPADYRWRGTDILPVRIAAEILAELGYEHRLCEYDGRHAYNSEGKQCHRHFMDYGYPPHWVNQPWSANKVRNRFPKKVIAVTPRQTVDADYNNWGYQNSPHAWWVSINKTMPGTIPVDWVRIEHSWKYNTYEQWADYRAYRDTKNIPGAEATAEIKNSSTIQISTRNVGLLSLWLHQQLVDISQPIKVIINGHARHYVCQVNLLAALRSYERRKDWDLIYPCEIEIDVDNHESTVTSKINATPKIGESPLTVQFSGLESFDSTGLPITHYRWTVDNGLLLSEQAEFTHTFTQHGRYTIVLEAKNHQGHSHQDSVVIQVAKDEQELVDLIEHDLTEDNVTPQKPAQSDKLFGCVSHNASLLLLWAIGLICLPSRRRYYD